MSIISKSDDLQLLLAVVDSGGFSAAARLLDIPVATVSRAISRLEKRLAATLLNRTTRRIELTEEGQRFVSQVRQGLAQLELAEESLRSQQQRPQGKLRVDAVTPFILHQLVPLVAGFRQTYPDIQLELVANESIIDLIEQRADVAIRIGPLEDSNLHARFLGRSPLAIVASPDYLARRGVPEVEAALAEHSVLGFANAPHLNVWPLTTPWPVKPVVACNNGESIRQLCLAGEGVALLSRFMIADDLAQGRLVAVLDTQIQRPHPREQVQVVFYKNTTLSPRIRAFVDYISPRLTL
ncbi:LysR family transcriptional regulator [Gallaecimonas sp. GXIMD1310]|uniref:LysR family transcriptional regulator n=1 Tax=Gallaecimonas sp. GXIMD1310 TaxID=3131926 RepID=UPI0038731B04